MGSRGVAVAFGILLLNHGVEFEDWSSIEGSCLKPGERRCCAFSCGARESNQKS